MKNVFVVYAHPSHDSFTYMVKEAFLKGLEKSGKNAVVSDLYEMKFDPVISETEYLREAYYDLSKPVPSDVLAEQKKINDADAVVFIYPDFWTASPAMLEGWFQRVLTYGYAYGDAPEMKSIDKAVFLMTMGGCMKDDIRQREIEAMKTIMIGDRLKGRVNSVDFYVFDEMTRGYGSVKRDENMDKFLKITEQAAVDL